MEGKEIIIKGAGGYGRNLKFIFGVIDKCDICGTEAPDAIGISVDASEEEYHDGQVCLNCIHKYLKI